MTTKNLMQQINKCRVCGLPIRYGRYNICPEKFCRQTNKALKLNSRVKYYQSVNINIETMYDLWIFLNMKYTLYSNFKGEENISFINNLPKVWASMPLTEKVKNIQYLLNRNGNIMRKRGKV